MSRRIPLALAEAPSLRACPFCGAAVRFEGRQPGGTGASGMEPYDYRIICDAPGCDVRPGSAWRSEADYDWKARQYVPTGARELLAEAWNRRTGS